MLNDEAPARVADLVHDAIAERRFWIFTSPETPDKLRPRYASIVSGTNPERGP
jgi:hypothetical protein